MAGYWRRRGRRHRFWPEYVSVDERRAQAAARVAVLEERGRECSPIRVAGRTIASTFWGQAWCHNLEAYSDFANRLPRGRTYLRAGAVLDLQIAPKRVTALVSGSDLYTVEVEIQPLPRPRWNAIKQECAGQIGSLVELLKGSLSKGVMEIVSRKGEGLFPSPKEISLRCTCPDWATMCKHVAATLYAVGARLDQAPELLFTLRGVDPGEMIEAAVAQPVRPGSARRGRPLADEDLSAVFGVEIETAPAKAPRPKPAPKKRAASKRGATTQAASRGVTKRPAASQGTTKRPATKRRAGTRPATSAKTTPKPRARGRGRP